MSSKISSDSFCIVAGSKPLYSRLSGHYAELPSSDEKIQKSVQPAFQELLESAARDGWAFAEMETLYRAQPSERKIAIAQILSEKCPGALVKHFRNFEIPKEHHLRLALECAKQAGQSLLLHYKEFNLSDDERGQLFLEVAKTCPSEMAEALEDMDEPLKTRQKLAHTIAALNGRAASTFYKNFRITEPAERFEDAKLAFKNDPLQSAKSIDEYDLDEESQRFELLKMVVAQDPSKVLSLAKAFRITHQDYLYELAKAHAAHDGWSFCCQFAEWNIQNQDRLFEIFKSAAAQNGRGFIQNRTRVPFTTDKISELMEIASRQSGIAIDEALRKE